ncbi:MAG: cyanophycinase [Nocardioidaceae bacterium]
MPNPPQGPGALSEPGTLLPIGGAEDKVGRRTVLKAFTALAGGEDARIAVVPTASSLGPEVVEVYDALFRRLGAHEVLGVRPESREQADHSGIAALLDDVTAIFLTGGNQLKLSGIVNGTAFGRAIQAAHQRGVLVGGTSAGASILSSHMVAFGSGGSTPKQRMTQLAAGLGLVRDVVIDQHFGQRNRYGRLLMLVAQNPGLLGVGLDEDTGAVITGPDERQRIEVVGRGAVTIFDGSRAISNAYEARRTAPILVSGVVVHVLPAGAVFDLSGRALVRASRLAGAEEVEQHAVAGRDLKRLAQDIKAGDISPSVLRRRRARQSSEGERG